MSTIKIKPGIKPTPCNIKNLLNISVILIKPPFAKYKLHPSMCPAIKILAKKIDTMANFLW